MLLPSFENSWLPLRSSILLLIAVLNATPREVVRRKLQANTVSRQDFDKVETHFAGNLRKDLVAAFELDAKHGVGQGLADHALHLDRLFFLVCLFFFRLRARSWTIAPPPSSPAAAWSGSPSGWRHRL